MKIQPINYQEHQETLAEVGAKAAVRCGFGPGLDNNNNNNNNNFHGDVNIWEASLMLIWQQKNRAFKFVRATYFTFTWVWTGLCFCMTPVWFFFSSSSSSIIYIYCTKVAKHWADTRWIKFSKLQVVSVGFPLNRTNSFHYCITVTWHTKCPLRFKHRCFVSRIDINSRRSIPWATG